MNSPTRAIVLAAGFGSRLAPLTQERPKPLVPFWGKPLLGRILEQLRSWGVRETAINLHHRADRLRAEAERLAPKDMRLIFSFEPTILGTGGALFPLADFARGEPVWLCNADVVMHLDPAAILDAHHDALATLWMIPDKGPRSVSVLDGCVRSFRHPVAGCSRMTFSGLHLLSPRLFSRVPPGVSSIIELYEAAMAEGERIHAVAPPQTFWADIGRPADYLQAHQDSLGFPGANQAHPPAVIVRGWAAVEDGAVVEPGVVLDHAIVWSDARICSGATLRNGIAGAGAFLRHGATAEGVLTGADAALAPEERALLQEAGAPPVSVEQMPPRGSDRSYRRVFASHGSVILVRNGGERPENHRFVRHTRFLHARGLRVPTLRGHRADNTLLVLEDLGRTHLLDMVQQASPHQRRSLYQQVLRQVCTLHRRSTLDAAADLEMEPGFDDALYRREHQLFQEEFVQRHAPELPAVSEAAFDHLRHTLKDEPLVLVHRDLQSTNILWSDAGPALIDYQGMRVGAAAYDLGSLLADPYVGLPLSLQRALLSDYATHAERPVNWSSYQAGAVQRLLQALGAFGRLGAQPATRHFLQHVPAAVLQIQRLSADRADFHAFHAWATAFLKRQPPFDPLHSATTGN